ncbi:hypothetical protein H4I95_08886 [Botrytis cinerea]
MNEDKKSLYYPITNRQRYPSIPLESAEVTAPSNQNIGLQYQYQQLQEQNNQLQSQCNQIQIQHNRLQTEHSILRLQYSRLQSYFSLRQNALERVSLISKVYHAANLIEHDEENDESLAHASSADRSLYNTSRSQKIEPAIKEDRQIAPVIKEEVIEDDNSRPTPDRGYSPSPAGFSDEEIEDEDYEPIPAPIAPATVARTTAG